MSSSGISHGDILRGSLSVAKRNEGNTTLGTGSLGAGSFLGIGVNVKM